MVVSEGPGRAASVGSTGLALAAGGSALSLGAALSPRPQVTPGRAADRSSKRRSGVGRRILKAQSCREVSHVVAGPCALRVHGRCGERDHKQRAERGLWPRTRHPIGAQDQCNQSLIGVLESVQGFPRAPHPQQPLWLHCKSSGPQDTRPLGWVMGHACCPGSETRRRGGMLPWAVPRQSSPLHHPGTSPGLLCQPQLGCNRGGSRINWRCHAEGRGASSTSSRCAPACTVSE